MPDSRLHSFSPSLLLEEQGPRDGFQVEEKPISTELKIYFIENLVEAGLKRIQMTSFVHPKLVPQLADAEAVCAGVRKKDGVIYSGLVLNLKGLERAVKAGLAHVAVSMSASDTHSRKNANKSIPEAITEMAHMVRVAKDAGLTVRGGIQVAFGCRYEGEISEEGVVELAHRILDLGVDELSLADSTGMGNPAAIRRVMTPLVEAAAGKPVILHLHDTEGKGLANLLAGMDVGVRVFDTAFGGLGGCPFIRGATGNIATEDTAWMLHQMGIETGIDIQKISSLAKEIETVLGRNLPGKVKEVDRLTG